MGIKGLVTYCKNNNCYEEYDLVTVSRKQDIEILVDFYGIEQHIMELTMKTMANKYRNEYLAIPGAEYDEFLRAFREFTQVFKNLGIKLVYVVDGPKGLDKQNQLNKEKSWIYRFEKSLRLQGNYLEYCKNPQSPFQYIKEIFIRPFLMQDLFKIMIEREGGTVISLVYGEADYQIATLRKERNSWAVLTNDSDLFVFQDCPTIQIAFFDLDKDLMMGRNYRKNANNMGDFLCLNPRKLLVGIISAEILMARLNITSFDKLIDFSILMGNDYSIDFANELRDNLGIMKNDDGSEIADVISVAKWVEKQPRRLNETKVYYDFITKYPEVSHFIEFSINFYKCLLPLYVPKFENKKNEILWNYLEERYKNIDIPNSVLMIFHGYWYQKNCVEPHIKNNKLDINYLLIPIRKIFYGLFLQKGKSSVTEYQVPNHLNYTRIIEVDNTQQKINEIVNQDSQFSYHKINLKLSSWKFFEESWSYWDFQDSPKQYFRTLEYFRKFGTDIGFCCYILRTFYLLTTEQSCEQPTSSTSALGPCQLKLSGSEFRAVFCTVMFRLLYKMRNISRRCDSVYDRLVKPYPNSWFYRLRVCPSSVCLNSQEWLQVVYNLGYNLYGRSLRISHFFPDHHEFISGTVLTVFFEYVHNSGQRLRNIDSRIINEIYELMSDLYDEFQGVYEAIVHPV